VVVPGLVVPLTIAERHGNAPIASLFLYGQFYFPFTLLRPQEVFRKKSRVHVVAYTFRVSLPKSFYLWFSLFDCSRSESSRLLRR